MVQSFDGPVTISGDLNVTGALGNVLAAKDDPNVNPRVEEPGINLVRSFAYSAPLEDVKLKRP